VLSTQQDSPCLVDTIETRVHLPVPAVDVARLFWDVPAWMDVWNRIEQVAVLYDDQVHQEFAMEVERDGRIESVRTIRFRDTLPGHPSRGGGDIHFFSPTPPPTMTCHRGQWLFRPTGDEEDAVGRCTVIARRDYELTAIPREVPADFAYRRRVYHDNFEKRLAAILHSFTVHYASTPTARITAASTLATTARQDASL